MVTGFENIMSKLELPNIKILNTSSNPVKEEIKDAKAGVFWDADEDKLLGETIDVIVIAIEEFCTEMTEAQGGKMGSFVGIRPIEDYYAALNKGERAYPVYSEDGNTLTRTAKHLYLVSIDDSWKAYIMYWARSNFRYSGTFVSRMKMKRDMDSNPLPMWGGIWRLKPIRVQNDNNTWYSMGSGRKLGATFIEYAPESIKGYVTETRELWETQQKGGSKGLPNGTPAVLPASNPHGEEDEPIELEF